MKKKILCMFLAVALLLAAVPTFAADVVDLWEPNIPSSAKSYTAGTCRYGVTFSQYISKPSSGFGNRMYVSSSYIKWDGYTDGDMYLLVKPRDQNGNYMKSSWGVVFCGYNGRVCYSILDITPSSTAKKLYIRVENPGYTQNETNMVTETVIKNMECSGKFWL